MMARRSAVGALALVGFAGTVVLANYFVQHVGQSMPAGGPHTIPVGFGYRAPSGVLWVGVAFTLRDVVQTTLGKWAAITGIAAGAALSYLVAPELAGASAAAFVVSESLDFAVYTPLVERGAVVAAVVLSNTVGLVVDSLLFLELAFGSVEFWQGQVIGKAWMTLAAMCVVVPMRRRIRSVSLAA